MATLRQADLTIFSVDVIAGRDHGRHRLEPPGHPGDAGHAGRVRWLPAASAALVAYSLFLLPQILSFWLMNTSAIAEITDSFWDFNNMPMDIYNRWIRQIGVFVLPIFVITNFPPMFVLNKMPPVYLAWAFAAAADAAADLVRLLWKRGLRNYSSASS